MICALLISFCAASYAKSDVEAFSHMVCQHVWCYSCTDMGEQRAKTEREPTPSSERAALGVFGSVFVIRRTTYSKNFQWILVLHNGARGLYFFSIFLAWVCLNNFLVLMLSPYNFEFHQCTLSICQTFAGRQFSL